MDKMEHGRLLRQAMAAKGVGRQVVADVAEVKTRTVTNWTSGATMPSEREQLALRKLLGDDYDRPGDAVERAIRASSLIDWRKDLVLSFYKRNLHEQEAEAAG